MGVVALGAAGASLPPTSVPPGEATRLAVSTPSLQARIRSLEAQAQAQAPVALALPAGTPVPTMTVHDPTGDSKYPQGDVTGVGVLQNSHGTAFGATVKSPHNPTTDANWLAGNAAIVWFLDTNANGLYEYQVVLGDSTDHKLIAAVTDSSGNTLICRATATFIPKSGYRATAGAGCLPHLGTVRFAVGMAYDTVAHSQAAPDFAPDRDLGPATAVQQGNGYWMLGSDGHVYQFGKALGFTGRVPGAQAMAPRKDGTGYWVVDFAGRVSGFGSARSFGGSPALGAGELVSTISATADDNGYWLFTNRGRAFPFGDANSYGDMSGTPLNGPIVASVATPTGHGYYMVGSDGGIFSFGDAHFHGSTGGMHLNKPIVGIAPTPNGKGYWLVASDGGVFAFGSPFRGSMGGTHLNQPVDGLVAFGNGYLMVASDGGIFDFSNKSFLGSLPPTPPTAPIVGIAAFSV